MEFVLAKGLLLLYMIGTVAQAEDKRVLLHSDQDLYHVISSIQAEMTRLNSSFQTQTTTIQSEMETLKQFANNNASTLLMTMATLNASLTAEVAALKSSLQSETAMASSLRADVASLNSSLQTEIAITSSLNSSLQTERALTSSLQEKTAALQSKVASLEKNNLQLQQATGSTYIRWGRTSCPGNGTDMIYKGRMAGTKYSVSGGGSNSLCLPDVPTWSKYTDSMTGYNVVAGTEIDMRDSDANVLFGKPVFDQDVPCAMCKTSRSSAVMFPGRASCYPGWTTEYHGYVVAGHIGNKDKMEFVCLDAGLEFAPHGAANDNDHVLEVAEVECGSAGSLPCPPFVNGRELACVVCSK